MSSNLVNSSILYCMMNDDLTEMPDALEIIFRKRMKFQSLNSRSCRNSKLSLY